MRCGHCRFSRGSWETLGPGRTGWSNPAIASAGADSPTRRSAGVKSRPGISSRSRKHRVNTCAIPWTSMTSRRWPAFRLPRAAEIGRQESGGRSPRSAASRGAGQAFERNGGDGRGAARDDSARMGPFGSFVPAVGRVFLLHRRCCEGVAALDPCGAESWARSSHPVGERPADRRCATEKRQGPRWRWRCSRRQQTPCPLP